MFRVHIYLLLVLELSIFLEVESGSIFCFPDQKLTASGECVDCEYCPSGEGVDSNEEVPANQDGIALECRTCRPCPIGYWNNRLYGQMECMSCRLNCLALHRQEYTQCGGSSPGRCGACINSNYEDVDNNIESPCVAKLTTTLTSNDSVKSTEESDKYSGSQSSKDDSIERRRKEARPNTYDKELEIGQAASLAFAGVLFIVLLVIARYLWIHRTRPNATKCSRLVGTSGDTIASKDSSLLDATYTAKDNLGRDGDLETDTMLVHNEIAQKQGPRPELPSSLPSSGPGCITSQQSSRRDYPKYLLRPDDDFVKLAGKLIYDEGKYKPMFRELGLSEQDLHAQYELFYHQKHDYDYMIGCLLNKWIKVSGQGATLDVLCRALDDHEFHKVSMELIKTS